MTRAIEPAVKLKINGNHIPERQQHMDNSEQYLHLWAIVPPPDMAQQIDDLRKEFSVNFQCFKALKPPVHCTLYTLFKSTIAEVQAQIEPLGK